jgi:glycerol-3-phosphate dehydrogenase
VRREQAASLADALLRRTRLGLLAARELCGDSGGAEAAARAMGAELGWDEAQVVREVEAWREVARAEGLVPGREPVEEAA